jgi:hypothetical protein
MTESAFGDNSNSEVNMNMKRMLASAVASIAMLGAAASVQAAPIKTDIIMIVDESGSMGTVQANLRTNIGLFASILSAGGIDAQYGLVGYGDSAVRPRMLTDLTDPTGFAAAAQGLRTNGGTEPGYLATAFALNSVDNQANLFSFRSDAVKNIIIFTDEPNNGTSSSYGLVGGFVPTFVAIDELLTDNGALFNAVLSGANTTTSYGPLATGHSGQVFALSGLNTTNQAAVEAFVTAFAEAKLQETIDFCTANPTAPGCQPGTSVPVPGALALFGIGLFGLGLARRRMA